MPCVKRYRKNNKEQAHSDDHRQVPSAIIQIIWIAGRKNFHQFFHTPIALLRYVKAMNDVADIFDLKICSFIRRLDFPVQRAHSQTTEA